jgi:hypothetical protein
MNKRIAAFKFFLAGGAVFLLTLGWSALPVPAAQREAPVISRGVSDAPRADIIAIDRQGNGFDKREKVPVTFLHDQHTTILGREAADCTLCHGLTPRNFFDWNQKGTTGLTGEALMDAYHAACITCHQTRKAANLPAGPDVRENRCTSCHREGLPFSSIAMQVRMPLSLHAVHTESPEVRKSAGEEDACAACHHTVVDADSNALVLERGEEQPCFTCHFAEKTGDTPAVDTAAHQTCLTCHVALTLEGKQAGPTNCSTCHAVPLTLERKYSEGPRLERGQPAVTFILPRSAVGDPLPLATMSPAVFNHALHEGLTEQCSSCHHQRIDSCGKCHTLAGEARGEFINLHQASHTEDPRAVVRLIRNPAGNELWAAGRTCTGCHQTTALQTAECAGCHTSVNSVKSPWRATPGVCEVCHVSAGDGAGSRDSLLLLGSLRQDAREGMAGQAASGRDALAVRVDLSAIPQEVEIGDLASEYMPVKFPHGKAVRSLLLPIRESRLAAAFHRGDLLACAGCHHNGTAGLNPPPCGSCHARQTPLTPDGMGKPPLKAAFHQRCMSCHTAMNVAEPAHTDCEGCHAARPFLADAR